MDRAELTRRLLEANAVRPAVRQVVLPLMGETVALRRPTNDQVLATLTTAGDDLDQGMRATVNALRWMLVDDDGQLLLMSYAEAAGFFNLLEGDDLMVLMDAVTEMVTETTSRDPGDGEVGKGS